MKKISLFKIFMSFLIVFTIFLSSPVDSLAKENQTIAILPFEINAQEDISYITSGVLMMLESRLSWKDHVGMINRADINKALDGTGHLSENKLVLKTGNATRADYVVTGSITEFSNAFSLDVKIYDIENQSFLTFYDQAPKIDEVIQKTDIIAAKINKKVFDRTTLTFERLEKEAIVTEEDLKRMHPEQMMPIRPSEDNENTPWWKFWKLF